MSIEVKSNILSTGVTLQYAEQGEKKGVPVIFLHGLSDSWHSFELVLAHLPESVHAFALTLRGHGDSSHPKEGYSPQNFVADVKAFMDTNNLETAIIVAHSMGCLTAQLFAVEHPERVQGLVLMGSPYRPMENQSFNEFWEFVISPLEDPVAPEFVRGFQESTLVQYVPEEFIETVIAESLKVPARVWKAVVEGVLKDDLSKELKKIKSQTILIWGDQDGLFSRSDQDEQLAVIENSKLLVYEGAGHGVHWEEPEKVVSDLLNFIKDNATEH